MFRRIAAASTMVLATALPLSAETLADAMVAAYRHSALIEQNRAVLRAADEEVATAVSTLRPVLQWVASHTVQKSGGTSQRTTTAGLSAQLTLYDWGRSQLAIDGAKEQVLATRQALVGVEQDVLLSATQAFFNVREAEEQVALQRNSVEVLTQTRQAARDRFEVGEITVTDVALADAQLAQTQATLASAQGQLDVAREDYLAAVGRMPGDLAPPPPLPRLPDTVDAARAISQRTHPAILQSQRLAAATELAVAAAAAESRPLLSGTAGASVERARSPLSGEYDTSDGLSAGLELSQRLYSGGALASSRRRAMAQRDEARAALLNTARQVSQAVGTSWANISVARAQISAIDEQIVAAQQAYEGVREEALLGARTTLDVLDSEQDLLEARANKITAESNLQLAHYQLLAAMGLLTVENLRLGIPTYDPSQYYNAVRSAPARSSQGNSLDRVLRAIGRD